MDAFPIYSILRKVLAHCGISDLDLQAAAQEVVKTIPKVRKKQSQLISDSTLEDRFERFWKAYPKKLCKGDARKAWLTILPNEELLGKMLRTIETEKKCSHWQDSGGKFIPYPASWLNAEGWENEVNIELTPISSNGAKQGDSIKKPEVTFVKGADGRRYAKTEP